MTPDEHSEVDRMLRTHAAAADRHQLPLRSWERLEGRVPTEPSVGPGGRRCWAIGGGLVAAGVLIVVVALVVGGGGSNDEGLSTTARPGRQEQWQTDLGRRRVGPGQLWVTAGEGQLYVNDVTTRAYDADDGTLLWTTPLDNPGLEPPVPLDDGEALVLHQPDGAEPTTTLVDARSGAVVWEREGQPVDSYRPMPSSVPTPDLLTSDIVLISVLRGFREAVLAVDRGTGGVRWEQPADDATICGGRVVTTRRADPYGRPGPASVSGRTLDDGRQVWSHEGTSGPCVEGEVAVVEGAQASVVDVVDGAVADRTPLPGAGDVDTVFPTGDAVVAVSPTGGIDESGRVVIVPRDGGEPTWDSVGGSVTPLEGGLVLVVGVLDGYTATLVRPSDGRQLGQVTLDDDDPPCAYAITPSLLATCLVDRPVVTGHDYDAGLSARWTDDTGLEVGAIALDGDRLFATDGERLVAYG